MSKNVILLTLSNAAPALSQRIERHPATALDSRLSFPLRGGHKCLINLFDERNLGERGQEGFLWVGCLYFIIRSNCF
jgi:hypothetical protein